MNAEELETLRSLGIGYIMDLRTTGESLVDPDPILPGVEMVRHSGLVFKGGEEIDFSPTGMNKVGKAGEAQLKALTDYYSIMPFDNEAFGILMKKLMDKNVPLIFHCATGKDRTGVAAMIILAALGIPKETILRDYLLSNYYHRETINRVLEENKEQTNQDPVNETLLRMRTGVTELIGKTVLDAMLAPGSKDMESQTSEDPFLPYLQKEFGLSTEDLKNLRDFYLE